MKKKLFTLGAFFLMSLFNGFSQEGAVCGTKAPDENWENWFQSRIAEFKKDEENNRGTNQVVTIPIIVHIVHKGTSTGSGANIAARQVEAQIDFLNDCMAGNAPGNSSLPAPFANVDAGDIPIRFCLASKDPGGKTLAEKGINRISITSKNWKDPATLNNNEVMGYFDGTIKPGTIWDPKKYFNIWVGDFFDPAKGGLLGWAKFPASSTLTGIPGGSDLETSSNSGVVMATRVFGCKAKYSNGYYANEAYIYGVTTAHEVGHWLGLRHIGGDQNCGNDYCSDTPTQKGGHKNGQNGQNWGCPSYPFQVNGCGSGGSPNGEMFQNFMDYSDDQCRSLFTANQETRMLTAMKNSPYRKDLGTHGLCSTGPAASFNANKTTVCAGESVTFTDQSAGSPVSWKWTFNGANPASSTIQNPAVVYPTAGTFNVKLVVGNAQGKDSITKTQYIVVRSAPAVPTITHNSGVLTSSQAVSYQWYRNAASIQGATAQTYKATQEGSYTVEVTDANGCKATSAPFLITGVAETSQNVFIDVFPNPGKGQFNIRLQVEQKGDYVLELRNTLGQDIYKETLTGFRGTFSKELDISKYGKGIYFFSVSHPSDRQLRKLVVY